MKVILIKDKLKEVIDTVDRVCSKKGELQILNFFHLTVSGGKIHIHATDLELSYQAYISGRIEEEGEVLLPAKQFAQVIDGFYEDTVTLTQSGQLITISGEHSQSQLTVLIGEEYPYVTNICRDNVIEIESDILDTYFQKLLPCLRTADIFKPELAGVYLSLEEHGISLVSTDTLRLAEAKIKKQLFEANKSSIQCLIPKKIIQEYISIKRKPHKVRLFIEPHQITFDLENHLFTSKLLPTNYPPYKKVIPESFMLVIYAPRSEIIKALKLNRVFLDQTKNLRFIVSVSDQTLQFISRSEVLGESKNVIPINIKENQLPKHEICEFTINHEFLNDGISTLDGDTILFGLNIPASEISKPILCRSPLDDDFTYVVMPL